MSDGTSTNLPTANDLSIFSSDDIYQFRVEAISGITDWRTVVTNFYNSINTNIPSALATIALSGAGQLSHTASITVTYKQSAGAPGGVAVGGGKFTNMGSPTNTHRLASANALQLAGDASGANHPIANNAGNDAKGQAGEPSNTGVFVETVSSGSSETARVEQWLDLGKFNDNRFNIIYATSVSQSNASRNLILISWMLMK